MKTIVYILLPVLALWASGCGQPTEFERENANDPLGNNFIPDKLESFSIEARDNGIYLEWESGSEFITGYKLEKTNSNGTYEAFKTFDPSVTSYLDQAVSPFRVGYKISYSDSSAIGTANELEAAVDLNPTNFLVQNSTNNGVEMKWNDNTYFETSMRIERRSGSGEFEEIGVTESGSEQYADTQLSHENIGANQYRITAISEVDESESLISQEVRLPAWNYQGNLENLENTGYMISDGDYIYGLIPESGFSSYYSYKIDLTDLSVSEIQSPPGIGISYNIGNAVLLGEKILTVLPDSYFAIYDTDSDSWELYNEPLLDDRTELSVLKLNENSIIVSGGVRNYNTNEALRSALLFDISTSDWTVLADMILPRYSHKSVLTDDGRVVVLGENFDNDDPGKSGEIYNPNTDTWSAIPDPPIQPYKAVKMIDGKVLVLGARESAELNLSLMTWENNKIYEFFDEIKARLSRPVVRKLNDGNILLMGHNSSTDFHSGSGIYAQIYLSDEKTWVRTGKLNYPTGYGAFALVRPNSDILLIHERVSSGVRVENFHYSVFQKN